MTPLYRNALKSWKNEAKDSMKACRNESNIHHTAMRQIVVELQYETLIVFGPDDSWITENMCLLFESPPTPFSVRMERQPLQVRLENHHIRLYHRDLSLYRWKKIYTICDSILQLNTLPVHWFSIDSSLNKKALKHQMNQQIAKDLWQTYELEKHYNLSEKAKEVIEFRNLKYEEPRASKSSFLYKDNAEDGGFPIKTKHIKIAFPAIGQFNFYVDGIHQHKGILEINARPYQNAMAQINNEELDYIVEWTEAKSKRQVFTKGIFFIVRSQFQFDIPTAFLKKGKIYSQRILVVPRENEIDYIAALHETAIPASAQQLAKSVEVWSNYFRCSKTDVMEKWSKIDTTYNRNAVYQTTIQCKEPFDSHEIISTPNLDRRYRFSTSENLYQIGGIEVLKLDEALSFYFEVPQIESIDTINLNNVPKIELDKSVNAPFMHSFTSSSWESRRHNSDTLFFRDAVVPINKFVENDSIYGVNIASGITIEHFDKGKVSYSKKNIYYIYAPALYNAQQLDKIIKIELEERSKERAQFFYQLAIRKWKKDNQNTAKPNYSDFLKKEQKCIEENLKQFFKFSNEKFATIKFKIRMNSFLGRSYFEKKLNLR